MAEIVENPKKSQRILVLYNAWSGHRQLNFQNYLRALADHDAQIETRTISKEFNIKELLSDASKFDRVVVAGGDGTVSAAAGILQGTGIPIIAYPGGTANLLARNLNIPANPEILADLTVNGAGVPTDLGELEYVKFKRRDLFRRRFLKKQITGTPVKINFSVMTGIGFAARLMSQAKPWKARLGEAAYWVGALTNMFPRRAQFLIRIDDKEIHASGIGILVINFERIQFDLKVVSEAAAQDGKLDIAVIKARSLFGLIPIIWSAIQEKLGWGRPRVHEVMETYQASEVEIFSRPPLRLQFDGEVLQKASSFKIRVCPGAATFVYGQPVPAASQA